jgi:hypothetical protein
VHRINIGCGETPTRGWLNFDNSASLKLSSYPMLSRILRKVKLVNDSQWERITFCRENTIVWANAAEKIPLPSSAHRAPPPRSAPLYPEVIWVIFCNICRIPCCSRTALPPTRPTRRRPGLRTLGAGRTPGAADRFTVPGLPFPAHKRSRSESRPPRVPVCIVR